MALARSKARIFGDHWVLSIDGNDAPHHVSVALALKYAVVPTTSQGTGSTPIGAKVEGKTCDVTLVLKQWGDAELADLIHLTGTGDDKVMLDEGDEVPKRSLRLHPKKAADNTGDIFIPEVAFYEKDLTADSAGNIEPTFRGMAIMQDDGTFLTGVAEPEA